MRVKYSVLVTICTSNLSQARLQKSSMLHFISLTFLQVNLTRVKLGRSIFQWQSFKVSKISLCVLSNLQLSLFRFGGIPHLEVIQTGRISNSSHDVVATTETLSQCQYLLPTGANIVWQGNYVERCIISLILMRNIWPWRRPLSFWGVISSKGTRWS